MQINQAMIDDPIASRLIEEKSPRAAVLYLVALQFLVIGALEFVAVRALPHTYDEFLIRTVMWVVPFLGVLINLYALVRRTNVYLYTNLVWRFVSATITALIVLTLLTSRS